MTTFEEILTKKQNEIISKLNNKPCKRFKEALNEVKGLIEDCLDPEKTDMEQGIECLYKALDIIDAVRSEELQTVRSEKRVKSENIIP